MKEQIDPNLVAERIQERTSHYNIKQLEQGQVFVFGSNDGGRHGKGAAKLAMQKFGARWGVAEGMQGRSYGIPTVNATITGKLSLQRIEKHVQNFIKHARLNSGSTFLVTEIGCGLAGWWPEVIAPFFEDAIVLPNVHLPKRFWQEYSVDQLSVILLNKK